MVEVERRAQPAVRLAKLLQHLGVASSSWYAKPVGESAAGRALSVVGL
jgi:hypothetical protein